VNTLRLKISNRRIRVSVTVVAESVSTVEKILLPEHQGDSKHANTQIGFVRFCFVIELTQLRLERGEYVEAMSSGSLEVDEDENRALSAVETKEENAVPRRPGGGKDALERRGNDGLVETNLFASMAHPKNLDVVAKLAFFSVLMAVLPLSAFLYMRDVYLPSIGVKKNENLISALTAVLVVQCVIGAYVAVAFSEKADPEEEHERAETKKTK